VTDFEEVEIKLTKGVFNRLKKISEILDTPLDKVINTSLLDGILPLWIPYQNLLNEISDKENPINEEDYQDVLDELSTQINSDFEIIQRLESLEDEFEEMFPFGHFTDLQERRTEFIKFLRVNREIEEVEVEEVAQEPIQEKIKETPATISEKEEEEEIIPSLFSRFKSFIKSQIDSHINNLGDVFILGIFLILLGLINFLIFYSLYLTWPFMFDFIYMITTYIPLVSVISIIMVILLFPIMILLTGFIIGELYYYLIRIFRKKKQH